MGLDGGEAGRMVAAEEEYIRRELQDTNAFCNAFWVSRTVKKAQSCQIAVLTQAMRDLIGNRRRRIRNRPGQDEDCQQDNG